MAGPLPPLGSRPDVQGLRALAVAVVIFAHAGVGWLAGGYVGVDVFFVVSGFIISALLLREASATGRVRVGDFYARRARRILPAAGLMLVATAMFAASRLPVSRVAQLVEDIRWSALFAANVHFARLGENYMDQGRALSPVQHMWSLAVEEQFYLLWPVTLLVIFAGLAGRRRLVTGVVLAMVWCVSLTWSVVQTAHDPATAYFSSLTRAWELATGALVAVAALQLARLPARAREVLVILGLGAIGYAVLSFDTETPFPSWRAAVPVLGTAAVLAAGTGGTAVASRVLRLGPVRYVGDISYSLYLWHWPVIVLGTYVIGHAPTPPEMALLLVVVVAASVTSYHLVENPVRRQRWPLVRGLRGLVLWPVTLALVLAVCTWSYNYATDAFQARIAKAGKTADSPLATPAHSGHRRASASAPLLDPPIQRLIRTSVRKAAQAAPIPFPLANLDSLKRDIWQTKFDCYSDWDDTTARLCPRGSVGASRHSVVYGDSHAGMWLPPLEMLATRHHVEILPLVKLGCAPFDVVQTKNGGALDCRPFRTWALNQMRRYRPEVIYVSYRSLLEVVPPTGETSEQAWAEGARTSLRQLTRIAPRVVIIGDITGLPYAPADCLTAPNSTMASCTSTTQDVTTTGNTITHDAAESSGARFIDVQDLVCADSRCPLVIGGLVTYHDEGHISRSWSLTLAAELGRRLGLEPGRASQAARERRAAHDHVATS